MVLDAISGRYRVVGWRSIFAVVVVATAAALATPGALHAADRVAVIVVPDFDPHEYAGRGAVGLVVPGAGPTVSRDRARASLVRGRVVSSLVDLDGDIVLQLSDTPAETTIYVALPPEGEHPNVSRYPVAVVGPGYGGLLTSRSTRIGGLVSLADIAPTAAAIAAGSSPRLRSRPDPQAAATLARLDISLVQARDARKGATLALIGWLVAFSCLGVLAGSTLSGRAAILVPPVTLAAAILLRAVGVDDPATVIATLAVSVGPVSLLLALRQEVLVPAIVGFLAAFLVVLLFWPEVNALAVIGPHPDGGGRFFGVTNEVETLLLVPALAAATLAGLLGAALIGLLLLVTVGSSRAGADGGGVIVVLAAFTALLVGRARVRLTPLRVGVGLVAVLAISLAAVGFDALLGGSSHVTEAIGGGPGAVLDDLQRRARISWAGATMSTQTVLFCVMALGGFGWLGWRGRRSPVIVAMLVAVGVSILVNDTPVDVLGYGALGCLALTAWDETRAAKRVAPVLSGAAPAPGTRCGRPSMIALARPPAIHCRLALHVPLAGEETRHQVVEQAERHPPEDVTVDVYPVDLDRPLEVARGERETSSLRRITEPLHGRSEKPHDLIGLQSPGELAWHKAEKRIHAPPGRQGLEWLQRCEDLDTIGR